jgi:hypothetical protein
MESLHHRNRKHVSSKQIDNSDGTALSMLDRVSAEIETMRIAPSITDGRSENLRCFHSFPPACLEMLTSMKGNHRCVDCGEQNPQWAACRYGVLLCLRCSGHHRSLGVQISSVRSISMDEWSVTEVVSMLEGGNSQLAAFFDRHALTERACNAKRKDMNNDGTTTTTEPPPPVARTTPSIINEENVTRLRYKTKAALFYRIHMKKHVDNILAYGPYRGREISRQLDHQLPNDDENGC